MQGAPDCIPGSWFPGNKETAESRKQAREHRHGGVITVTSGGEMRGSRLGCGWGPAKPEARPVARRPRVVARGSAPRGECATTCCRGGDRVIRLLSERVQGATATNRRIGEARG